MNETFNNPNSTATVTSTSNKKLNQSQFLSSRKNAPDENPSPMGEGSAEFSSGKNDREDASNSGLRKSIQGAGKGHIFQTAKFG